MIYRFCLYGFLKNQRYFEAFWILAMLDRGLSFALIGSLIGFRELSIVLLEIPTGAIADVVGRRGALISSHIAYIAAFAIFGLTRSVPALFLAMFSFAVGEAFRTGTHKAIIFAWLKREGREGEKTHIYGVTRSWSKIGSAVSVLIAAVCVVWFQDYMVTFWLSAVPTALNIVNFLGYPRDGEVGIQSRQTLMKIVRMLRQAAWQCLSLPPLRRSILESMGYEGMYNASKDYLQPILQQLAMSLPVFLALTYSQRTAALVAIIYSTLYLLGSVASRYAGRFVDLPGTPFAAARWLWAAYAGAFTLLLLGTVAELPAISIASFVLLSMSQNLWRPILIGRIADQAEESVMATVLSVESQAKSFAAALLAPLLGLMVDHTPESLRFAPIAIVGILLGCIGMAARQKAAPNQDSALGTS